MDISEGEAARHRRHRRWHRRPERSGRAGILSSGVEAGLWILLIATPLALGSVSRTATVLMEGACFALLVLAWWAGMGREGAGVPRAFKVVAAGFVFWSLLQVVPLPPSVLGRVSPGTHRLYGENLPGYASGERSADLQSWLLQRRDTPSADLEPRPKNRTGFEGKRLHDGCRFLRSGFRRRLHFLLDALEQIQPGAVGQSDIQDDRIRRMLPQGRQPLACGTRLLDTDVGQVVLDNGAQAPANQGVVVNHKQRGHLSNPR